MANQLHQTSAWSDEEDQICDFSENNNSKNWADMVDEELEFTNEKSESFSKHKTNFVPLTKKKNQKNCDLVGDIVVNDNTMYSAPVAPWVNFKQIQPVCVQPDFEKMKEEDRKTKQREFKKHKRQQDILREKNALINYKKTHPTEIRSNDSMKKDVNPSAKKGVFLPLPRRKLLTDQKH